MPCCDAIRRIQVIVLGNDPLRPFDNPLQDGRTGFLHQVVCVVLDVALPFELGLEGHDDKTPPCPFVIGAYPGQVVRIEDQRVCRYELERILILLFAAHFIRRAELFQDGRR